MFAFYRGSAALVYKLAVQHGTRFFLYENMLGGLSGTSQSDAPML